MLDEFDDVPWPAGRLQAAALAHKLGDPVPRLITRMYATSDERLRARLLGCLLKPLGSLGLVAIAAGAFAGFLQRRGTEGIKVSIEDVSRYSIDQIAELVRFVGQVSPESLQAVANTLADNPVGITAFSASVLLLLMRTLDSSRERKGSGQPEHGLADPIAGGTVYRERDS
jgi:hypothetical protein